MRQLVKKKGEPMYGVFMARGRDASRLEQLSDCVFALAITMSLLSTQAPRNFDELTLFISDVVPFTLSMVAVMWIWHGHYQFFMRYGLRDMRIIVLNTFMMLIVLFFIYPLKFLSTWLVSYFTLLAKALLISNEYFRALNQMGTQMIPWNDMPELMIIYDCGFLSIYITFVLMYRHAIKNSDPLNLSEAEVHATKSIIAHYTGIVAIGFISLSIALLGFLINWEFSGLFAGVVYALIGPVSYFIGRKYDKPPLSSTIGQA
jgi:uncharacterized membrane protein